MPHSRTRRAAIAGGVAFFGFMAAIQAMPASAMACFTIVGKMTCIDAAFAPPATLMPPVIMPVGGGADEEDHHIVIEDDGGRRVARG